VRKLTRRISESDRYLLSVPSGSEASKIHRRYMYDGQSGQSANESNAEDYQDSDYDMPLKNKIPRKLPFSNSMKVRPVDSPTAFQSFSTSYYEHTSPAFQKSPSKQMTMREIQQIRTNSETVRTDPSKPALGGPLPQVSSVPWNQKVESQSFNASQGVKADVPVKSSIFRKHVFTTRTNDFIPNASGTSTESVPELNNGPRSGKNLNLHQPSDDLLVRPGSELPSCYETIPLDNGQSFPAHVELIL